MPAAKKGKKPAPPLPHDAAIAAAEAAYAVSQRRAPAVPLHYTGKGAQVEGGPTRDLEAAETPRYLTQGAYDAALAAGIYSPVSAKAAPAPAAPAPALAKSPTGPGDAGKES